MPGRRWSRPGARWSVRIGRRWGWKAESCAGRWEEARDLLVGENDAAAARLGQAITMLEAGPLDRMELLIEEVRASL